MSNQRSRRSWNPALAMTAQTKGRQRAWPIASIDPIDRNERDSTIVNHVGPAVHALYSTGSENTEASVGMMKLVILAILLPRSSRSCTEWNRQSEVCHRL
jgi:hypothetical protein